MRKRGFSVVEIVLAMFLLSFCIALIASTFPLAQRVRRHSERLARATFLAQQLVEERLGQSRAAWPPAEAAFEGPDEDLGYRVLLEDWPAHESLSLLRVEIYDRGEPDLPVYELETLVIE